LEQIVTCGDAVFHGVCLAFGTEVLERTQLVAGEFSQACAVRGQLQKLSLTLGDFEAEEFREFSQLPTILALANGIAWCRLCNAAGIMNFNENLESIEREAAFGKELFKHD
jgi:hypothetical protein